MRLLRGMALALVMTGVGEAQCSWVVDVSCADVGGGVVLVEWSGDPSHVSFTVWRDGQPIATVPATQSSYFDSPGAGAWIYRVVPDCGPNGTACGVVLGVSAWFEVGVVSAAAGGVVDVPVTCSMFGAQSVNGGAFGLAHDPNLIPLDVQVGSDLALVNNGAGPDFFGFNLAPAGGLVMNWAASFMGGAADMLPPGDGLQVAVVTYAVMGTAPAGFAPIVFDETLGSPTIGYGISIENVATNGVDDPIDGGVMVTVGTALVRGDVDQNSAFTIGDPILALSYLFGGASVPCLEALDANASGTLDLTDPIRMLQMMFLGGPAFPAPYPTCGAPPQLMLGCASSACP